MKISMFKLMILVLFIVVGLSGTGCTTVSSASSKSIQCEAMSGNAVRILSIQARDLNGETLVSGAVKRNVPYDIPPGAHLHVTAFNSQNTIIAKDESSINASMLMRKCPFDSMRYATRLSIPLKDIARIGVEYHRDRTQ